MIYGAACVLLWKHATKAGAYTSIMRMILVGVAVELAVLYWLLYSEV